MKVPRCPAIGRDVTGPGPAIGSDLLRPRSPPAPCPALRPADLPRLSAGGAVCGSYRRAAGASSAGEARPPGVQSHRARFVQCRPGPRDPEVWTGPRGCGTSPRSLHSAEGPGERRLAGTDVPPGSTRRPGRVPVLGNGQEVFRRVGWETAGLARRTLVWGPDHDMWRRVLRTVNQDALSGKDGGMARSADTWGPVRAEWEGGGKGVDTRQPTLRSGKGPEGRPS